ncbi:MAG: glycosyltransferase family 39 protein, partial [Spirochaetia bacterium]|nr:glycosyltransferase family 39 protein [Spirochaetia bacterium]
MSFRGLLPSAVLALVFLGLQLFAAGFVAYGIFGDELYYLACTRHLAAGYVDHPPLSIWLLAILRVDGTSLLALRFFPALAGALTVLLAGLMTRRLGGSPWAAFLASACTAAMPVLQVVTGFYSMNALEPLIFTGLLYLLIEIQLSEQMKLWLLVGFLVGLGIINKHTMGVLAVVFVGAVIVSKWRLTFRSPYFYLAGLVVMIVILPNAIWMIQHDFISFEFYKNATVQKNIGTSPLKALADQVLATNPATLPVWALGVFTAIRRQKLAPFGIAFLLLLVFYVISGSSRPDRIVSIYPVMFAIGAIALSGVLRSALTLLILASAIFLAPVSMPLLPPETLGNFVRLLGIVPQIEKGKETKLPQWFADRFGWDTVASTVDEVIEGLPQEERSSVLVMAPWYAPAGAIELYSKYSPNTVSGHNSYYIWGLPEKEFKTIIVLGYPAEKLKTRFRSVKTAAF